MTDLVAGDVTATRSRHYRAGKKRVWEGTVAFGDGALTYPSGGVPLPAYSSFAMKREIESVDLYDSNDAVGIVWKYDAANKKLRGWHSGGFTPAGTNGTSAVTGTQRPMIVVEEAVTVSAAVGTLAYPPAYIVSMDISAGGTTGLAKVVPTGETPATLQVAVNFTTGGVVTAAGDTVTALRVTYFPQQTSGPFSSSNLVVDESIVAAAAKTTLANRAMAVQYVWDDTDGALDALEPVGEAPSATHTVAIDILNGSSATDIDFHGDDEGNTVKVTYLKYSGFKAGSQINDTDISAASYNFTESVHYRGLVVPGYGCVIVGETGAAANLEIKLAGPSRAAADNIAQWDPHLNTLSTAQTTPAALATFATPWFIVEQETETGSFTGGTAAAQTFSGSAVAATALVEISGAVAAQTLYARVTGT